MATRQSTQHALSDPQARSRPLTWVGAALLVAIAAIHVGVNVGFGLGFGYPGALFLLNAAGAIVLAAGILGGIRAAWHLGAVLAAASIVVYIVVHTTGLPGFYLEDWTAMVGILPLGPLSLVVEPLFLITYAVSFRGRRGH